jgi:16S rRNA C967 or C1407 C5-methylase (RsmB/RsmF family)/NOL1/NOP2/fmu family ribosome biogenesis protein
MSDEPFKLPEEFYQRMKFQLQENLHAFTESLKSSAPVSIRTNPRKSYSIDGENVPWSNKGKYLAPRPVFTLDPAFHAGAYYVQEASSMFLEQVFTQLKLTDKPLRILDVSAAPGGKSTHILSLVHPDSLLVANEVIKSRASVLAENLIKWGYDNYVVTNNDPKDFERLPGLFDVIVVDAPCSGEGLFRKDPDAIHSWSPQHAEHCAKRQRRILNDVWSSLKTNGILVYCTCTYNVSENEENMAWLNEQRKLEPIHLELKQDWGVEEVNHGSLVGYRFYPHQVKGEGFFISVVRKTEIEKEILIKRKRTAGNPPPKLSAILQAWFANNVEFQMRDNSIYSLRKELAELATFLQQHLKTTTSGIPVATLKGDRLVPEHALALLVSVNQTVFPTIELSLDEALAYLRRDSLILSGYPKGFTLVTHNELPLGWVNMLDNRVNNMYPKEWRIRMRP